MRQLYRSAWLDCGDAGFYPAAVVLAALTDWTVTEDAGYRVTVAAVVSDAQEATLSGHLGVEWVGVSDG